MISRRHFNVREEGKMAKSTLDTSAPTLSSLSAVIPAEIASSRRVASVAILRGLVLVLMAIDHVRVFSGLPPGGPTPAIFFTRWITHFCPARFIFLAGPRALLCSDTFPANGPVARSLALL